MFLAALSRGGDDVAEIVPGVVDVAKQFFGFREDELMRAHSANGGRHS